MVTTALMCFLLNSFIFVHSATEVVAEAMRPDRYRKEINAMPRNLSVHDDNGNPVYITAEEEPDWRTGKLPIGPITFTLYTRGHSPAIHRIQELQINDLNKLMNSNFNYTRPTRFVTHGWRQSSSSRSCVLIRDAYLNANNDNVIVVDWSSFSQLPYIWAANRVLMIGKEVGRMINFMVEEGSLNVKDTTLVGHSLGAHVIGLAGHYSKYRIRRLVGLDPALPMFEFAESDESISKGSGEHVEIIHTNAGVLGYLNAAGHLDFYPNGGTRQRGCCDGFSPYVCIRCSHDRAFEFFAESITNIFEGVLCNNYKEYTSGFCRARRGYTTPMGGANDKLATPGTYYLTTGSEPPFSTVN